LDPEDGNATYQLGLAYLGASPPRQLDGFWALARAASAKNRGGPQPQEIKAYLKKTDGELRANGCPSLVDAQLSD